MTVILISVRGVRMKADPDKRLDTAVKELVEYHLTQGDVIRLSAIDLVKMARSGGYILPKHLDLDDSLGMYGYCGKVLYELAPNHGSVKRETWGRSITYEFTPDIPKQGAKA